jgi:hypothetical protein
MQYSGMVGPDDCVNLNTGSCHVNCGMSCTPNTFLCSYPNYKECSGAPCTNNTAQPQSLAGCSNDLIFSSCGAAGVFARLQDCGPVPGHVNNNGCCESANPALVACVTTSLFTYLNGGVPPNKCSMGLGVSLTDGAG